MGGLFSAPALGQDATGAPRVSSTAAGDVEARWYDLPEAGRDYGEQVSRTNVTAAAGEWSAGIQLDEVLVLSNAYVDEFGLETRAVDLLAPDTRWPSEDVYLNLEKAWVRASPGSWEIDFGDFYASLGRGMALDVARRTEIDVDTSITGVRAAVQQGKWSAQALSGLTNPQQVQQDNRNREISPGLAHAVTAARVERYALGPLDVAVHGVAYTLAERDEPGRDLGRYAEAPQALISGGSIAWNGLANGAMDAYVEANRQFALGSGDGALPPGFAGYGVVTAYSGSVVLVAEGKRYRGTEAINVLPVSERYELVTPPSLEYERVITEDSSAATNSSDIWGARLRADWTAVPGRTTPYVSMAMYRDEAYDDALHFNRAPETIAHPTVGLQQFGWGNNTAFHTFANAGIRVESRDRGPAGEDYGADVQVHADFDVGPFPAEHGLDLAVAFERFSWGRNEQQQTDYTEIETALSWHGPAQIVFVTYVDYSDNPLVKGGALGSEGNLASDVYGALEVQWQPNPRTTVKAFYGAYKAGIRCAGGQCRQMPAFDGARASVTITP